MKFNGCSNVSKTNQDFEEDVVWMFPDPDWCREVGALAVVMLYVGTLLPNLTKNKIIVKLNGQCRQVLFRVLYNNLN